MSVTAAGSDRQCSFVIELDDVQFEDFKTDDLGIWKSTGVNRGEFVITIEGETRFQVRRSHGAAHYTLFRRYYVHGTCPTFHRLIVSIQGNFILISGSRSNSFVHLTNEDFIVYPYKNILCAHTVTLTHLLACMEPCVLYVI